jgi:hypothetical protein
MFDEHDHDRIDARVMFGGARWAFARPAAADDVRPASASRAECVPRVPAGKAERGCEQGRIVGVEFGEPGKSGA